MSIAIHESMVRVGASIGIYFPEGVPACMFLFDGKVLFISSGCSYYVYSIKHILNMHLIFISIRIWGLISFMTIDSFQAICILFCSLLFICSVLSKQFKYPSHHCPKWWIVCPSSKTNTTSPMLILWFCFVFFLCIYGAFCTWALASSSGLGAGDAQWRWFTASQAVVQPVVFQ